MRNSNGTLFKSLIRLCLFLFPAILASIPAFAADSYLVPAGATVTIDEHGECREVTNPAGQPGTRMVPTKSAAEWTSVRDNANGLTIEECTGGNCQPASGSTYDLGSFPADGGIVTGLHFIGWWAAEFGGSWDFLYWNGELVGAAVDEEIPQGYVGYDGHIYYIAERVYSSGGTCWQGSGGSCGAVYAVYRELACFPGTWTHQNDTPSCPPGHVDCMSTQPWGWHGYGCNIIGQTCCMPLDESGSSYSNFKCQ